MLALLIRWLLNALALIAIPYIYSGVQVSSFTTALIAALVLGLINAVIRPILVILTLPVTILTLGAFIIIINAICFWLTAEVIRGFNVSGFWAAIVGSVLFSVITFLTSWLVPGKKK